MIPLTFIYGVPLEYMAFVVIGSLIILIAHRDNIKRLLSGKERKLDQRAELSPGRLA
jgi:glycerol-3-phosphate acyltransferase PlsY